MPRATTMTTGRALALAAAALAATLSGARAQVRGGIFFARAEGAAAHLT